MTAKTDVEFWDRAADKYARSKIGDEAGYETTLARTRDFLATEKSVLELACGTGTTALKLAPSSGSYLATDISARMIEIANKKLSGTDLKNLTFTQATAETLRPPDGGFDVILGFNYLHLVADPVETLRTARKLLKPDGLLITKTVCLREMNFAIPILIKGLWLIGKAPENVVSMDEKQLIDPHHDAGLEILFNERHGKKGRDVRPFIVARRG